jgi:DHA1 family bicyclomycin/chloramphenicol resistance-like MFS transporter
LNPRALIPLLAFVVTVGSVATNIYIPALPAVRDYFGASVAQVQATFSVALLTYATGMLCWGPIADRYGRRRALLAGLGLMATGSLLGCLAQSLGALVAGRAVLAFGTATGLAVARTIVSDLYPERMARMLAQLTVVSVITSASAPVIGGALTHWFGWRSVFIALIGMAAIAAWISWRWIPETRRDFKRPPDLREMSTVAWSLVRQPLYLSCVLQSSAAYAMFVVFISLAPYVMVSAFGRPATDYGFYFPFISIGYMLGNWSLGRLPLRGPHAPIVFGASLQLFAALAALWFVAIGLRHPLWIFAPMGILYFGQGLFMPHLTAIAVNMAPARAVGVGSSTLGFLNQSVSALCVQLMGLVGAASALPMLEFCAAAALAQLVVLRFSPRMETPVRRNDTPGLDLEPERA